MRVVIYNRCSTEEEAQINALEIQAAESRELVYAKGWQLIDQYIESESGTSVERRLEYQRLLEDMECDKFDIIVIKSIDRLMRSAMDWYFFVSKLTRFGKQLYIYIDNKFYSPDDSLINGIKAILAEDFSRELSKKIKNAHKRRQIKKSGINITRQMFGWNRICKDVYEINEEEAESYRLAFELVKGGMGFYRLANEMYENGVRGKTGKRISETQWRNMLFSPRAYGTVVLHTREYDFDTKKFIQIPENEWIYVENALPPIVSKEYHDEVMEVLKERSVGDYTRDMSGIGLHELSGKVVCSECGAIFYRSKCGHGINIMDIWKCSTALTHGRKTEENRYGCNNIHLVEETVLKQMHEVCKQQYAMLFGDGESIIDDALYVLKQVFKNSNYERELGKYTKQMEKLTKRKELLFEKLLEEVISDEDFKKCNEDISAKMEVNKSAMEDIKAKMAEYNDYEERLDKIRESLVKEIVDRAKTQEVMKRIKKIVVSPDKTLEIEFCNSTKLTMTYEHKCKIERNRDKMNEMVLAYFQNNPEAKLKDLYGRTDKSESYVNTSIRKLKEAGMLRYERYGNHMGKWIVTENRGR